MEPARFALGAMTGTSLDGVDIALARIHGDGLTMRAELVAHDTADLGALTPRLRAAAEQAPLAAGEFAALALELGALHARVAAALCARAGVRPTLAAIHGQTIFHQPPLSWQLVNPFPVAQALGCPVVCDLRGADLCEGGQGAPLTPLADWVLFRERSDAHAAHAPRATPLPPRQRAIVNLGGFANATLLPAPTGDAAADIAAVRGSDICACNQLLDRAARGALGTAFDRGGAVALSGTAHAEARASIAAHLTRGTAGRSLGTGDEAFDCLAPWAQVLAPAVLLATVADAVGQTIGASLAAHPLADIVVAGGGAHNARLVQALHAAAGVPVRPSSELGVPVGQREALGWAVLGAMAQDGACVGLPGVTGRQATMLSDGLWCLPRGVRAPRRTP